MKLHTGMTGTIEIANTYDHELGAIKNELSFIGFMLFWIVVFQFLKLFK